MRRGRGAAIEIHDGAESEAQAGREGALALESGFTGTSALSIHDPWAVSSLPVPSFIPQTSPCAFWGPLGTQQ